MNGEGGSLHGFEFALSVPLDMFWEPLEGFGFTANYSEISSSIEPDGPGSSQPLPGLSKYISNMSVFYERWGFSARVGQRSRSDFRGEIQRFGGDRTFREFKGETVTDVQLGYTIQEGPLQNLGFLLQVHTWRTRRSGRPDRFPGPPHLVHRVRPHLPVRRQLQF